MVVPARLSSSLLITASSAQWSCTEIGHHIMMIYLNPLSKDCFSWELNNRKGDLTFGKKGDKKKGPTDASHLNILEQT